MEVTMVPLTSMFTDGTRSFHLTQAKRTVAVHKHVLILSYIIGVFFGFLRCGKQAVPPRLF